MTETTPSTIERLEAQEARLVLDAFDPAVAWELGSQMANRAMAEGAAVIIEIRRPSMVLFRVALAGTTAENQAWLDRKARTVFRFEASTALVAARFEAQGVDVWNAPWFDTERFTPAGGSFPVRVASVGVVGAITVSGLTSEEDHDFVVDALGTYLETRRPR